MSNSLPGLGNYFSFIVIHPVDNNEVKELLPKGLELAPLPPEVASIIPEGTHPLLFTLGHQKDVRPRFLGLFKLSYLEMSMNVPFVLQSNKKESGPYFFPASSSPRCCSSLAFAPNARRPIPGLPTFNTKPSNKAFGDTILSPQSNERARACPPTATP